ncbi:Retrotransposon protein, Ty1-Copia subclass [Phytophthora cinnamomi]|uniref:Retrotransposon protein, Ty1-Copia subclass n=1 Tax=Phytophthora cinnamomi TaxID=4785 RepID=UPI00355AC628|nr:Retrotransposon protein, Ty1-Copia subclass [Phytophthora cinnamomi]
MNRKMTGFVGKEIVTENWLCMEVPDQLPSDFWGSPIRMAAEWFSIENVEISLRRVFGDRSKKEINMLTEKKRPVMINVAKRFTGKKRNQVEATSAEPGSCFYCFEDVTTSTPKKKTYSGKGSKMATADAHAYDQQLAKAIEVADEFAFGENVPVSEGEEAEDKAFNPMNIDAEDSH